MNRPTRIVELLQLLSGKRSWTPLEIAGRFGISERTAYRDLADLSGSWHIPVVRDEHGYRLREGAAMRPLNLTASERATLQMVLANPALVSIDGASRTLELIDAKLAAATRPVREAPATRVLAGPDRSGVIRSGVAAALDDAIRDRAPVSLRYRSLSSGQTAWRGVDPYVVFYRRSAWYLAGRCHQRNETRTFRLDRMSEARRRDGTFEPHEFDLDDFLRHTWVIYRGRTLHRVVIHFEPALAPLIEDGVHHPDEKVTTLPNGLLEYRCAVSHLGEISRWIIGFAGRARAVSPPALVELVAESAGLVHAAHTKDDSDAPAPSGQDELPGLQPAEGRRNPGQPPLL